MSRLAPSFLPSTAVLEMTYQCNHQCRFCSCPWEAPKSKITRKPELNTPQWKNIISRLAQMGIMNLAFTGGEPLLRDDIKELLQYAGSLEVEHIETVDDKLKSTIAPPNIYLLSNGRLVNESILDLCIKHKIQLSMSLPGLSTYKYHTGVDNADHILAMFAKAKEKKLDTVVNITVTNKNLPELYENLSAAFLAGATQLLMNRFLPGGRGLKYAEDLSLTREQVREMLTVTENFLEKIGRFGSIGTELPKCIMDLSIFKRLEVGTRCSAATDFFVIGPSGYTRVCNHSEQQLVHFDQIEELKNHPYWKRFVFKQYLPPVCEECPAQNDCDGGCREAAHILGGSPDSPDPLPYSPELGKLKGSMKIEGDIISPVGDNDWEACK